MQTSLRALGRKGPIVAAWLAAFSFFTVASLAQTPAARIATEIDNTERVAIPGTLSPMARPEIDAGRVPAETKLQGISVVFSRSAAQEADLQALIAAQQNPTSPLYHQWLTPDEFAARFGLADADIAKVQSWLQQQGFSIDGISRSRNRITFSGTVGQAEAAFGAELHYYIVNGQKHFAPSADFTVPAALSSVVQTVTNLSTFRPKPRVKFGALQRAPKANFTSSQSGNHFLTPKDIATIYDINPAYTAGNTGAGQSIAVVGQSLIDVTDIERFQSAAGLTVKDPTLVLVPSSGTGVILSDGNEAESDLDLEYSGGIATGATIYFVYTGNAPNFSVWDSLAFAIENTINNQTVPVISISYGVCETALSQSFYNSLNNIILAQAAAQGQSVVAVTGDNGSTDCFGDTQDNLTQAQQQALAVDFPSSSQYVTAMGGTEFPLADVAIANTTFWTPSSGSDVISSAVSYIPEQVWNDDDSTNGLSSGGGGVSAFTPRPTWQAGVPGIPTGTFRLVPDISMTASPNNAGFLYCSSDTTTNIVGSCSHGFRDSNGVNGTNLTVAGGTSFDAPIFAGMLAIINQKTNSTGQGVAANTLYSLAADSNIYASAFHDTTSGSNACLSGPVICSTAGASQYSAAAGYDEASGLGSIDFNNLLLAWPTSSGIDFSLNSQPTTNTVTAGGSKTYAVSAAGFNGFTSAITLTCAVQSPVQTSFAPTCGFTSNSITPGGAASIMTVGTTTRSLLPPAPFTRRWPNLPATWLVLWVALFAVALFLARNRRHALAAGASVATLGLCLAFLGVGCGGGSNPPPTTGTPAGQYTITVTGTSGSLHHNVAVTLNVN